MSDEIRRVLELVSQGKVSVDDAVALIGALGGASARDEARKTAPPTDNAKRYMRINVHKSGRDGGREKDVNIRVPMSILRSGLRLGAIIPGFVHDSVHARLREQGVDIDLAKINPAEFEQLLTDLGEVNIDVNQGEQQVRITYE
jgi:SHOCT-like protein